MGERCSASPLRDIKMLPSGENQSHYLTLDLDRLSIGYQLHSDISSRQPAPFLDKPEQIAPRSYQSAKIDNGTNLIKSDFYFHASTR